MFAQGSEQIVEFTGKAEIIKQQQTHVRAFIILYHQRQSVRRQKRISAYLLQNADFACRAFISFSTKPNPARGPVGTAAVGHEQMFAQFHREEESFQVVDSKSATIRLRLIKAGT